MKILNQKYCIALDEQDDLKHTKERFVLPHTIIYLSGNTLGAEPKCSIDSAQKCINHEWDKRLIHQLDEPFNSELPKVLGDKIAGIIGAGDSEVMVLDSTAHNLFKTVASAIKIQAKQKNIASLFLQKRMHSLPTYMLLKAMLNYSLVTSSSLLRAKKNSYNI